MRRSTLVVLAALAAGFPADGAPEFLAGADVSHLPLREQRGHTYRDQGQARAEFRRVRDAVVLEPGGQHPAGGTSS